MCFGEEKRSKWFKDETKRKDQNTIPQHSGYNVGYIPNTAESNLKQLPQIHHITLSETMFSRTYCCKDENCNKENEKFGGKTFSEWNEIIESNIELEKQKVKAAIKGIALTI